MKKKFYLLLIVMLFSFVASAQRFEYQLGLKGGLGFDWVDNVGENVYSTEKGFCYKYGFTGIYYFGENYGLTSGFNIVGTQFAYKYNAEMPATTREMVEFKADYKTTYCQIPVLLKMRTDAFADKFRFLGEIGYGLNILASGEYKIDGEKQPSPYRDVCSSFIVHLGVDMEVMSRSTLQFIIAYDTFFSSIQSKRNDKLTMSNLCFELGFLF